MDFSPFDLRGYRTVGVADGYTEWAAEYERSVHDEMDLRLLERLTSVPWSAVRSAIDLACGTGRIGAWMTARGVAAIDGIDLTGAMLDRARAKGIYRQLHLASVTDTGLPDATYDLAIQSLADEHLSELAPLYREASRLTRVDGRFVIVGYHPFFLLSGIPTHYHRSSDNEPLAIESYIHLMSDHVHAASAAGWTLAEMEEGVVDDAWIAAKPKWAKHRFRPVSFAMVWRK